MSDGLAWEVFRKTQKVALLLGLPFSQLKLLTLTKNGLATIWAIFSQTYLVTLLLTLNHSHVFCEFRNF
jgi:hypothetical protein